jgi:predicted TPR repeat methyltransferase
VTSIFRRTPDMETRNYTASHEGRGVDYDERFQQLPMRATMWDMEQSILSHLAVGIGAATVLDLACGTGRISRVLRDTLPAADIIGVDVAESMLSVARERVPDASFIRTDIRTLGKVVPDASVDLVAAFRFFPNADPDLRAVAVRAIASVVRPGGHLIFNNHRNFWSPSYLARRLPRAASAPGASNGSLVAPLVEHGFKVVKHRSLGLLPHSDAAPYIVPERWAIRLERLNADHLSAMHTAGSNTVWLMQKCGAH